MEHLTLWRNLLLCLLSIAIAGIASAQPTSDDEYVTPEAHDLTGLWAPAHGNHHNIVKEDPATGILTAVYISHEEGWEPTAHDWSFRIVPTGTTLTAVVHTHFPNASCRDRCPELCCREESATVEMSPDGQSLRFTVEHHVLDECMVKSAGFWTSEYHRIAPIADLSFIDLAGSPTSHLGGATPFLLRAELSAPVDHELYALLEWDGSNRAVRLYSEDHDTVYESPLMVLGAADELGAARGLRKLPEFPPPPDGTAHPMAGAWTIDHEDYAVANPSARILDGEATVSDDGRSVVIRLGDAEAPMVYRSVEVSASDDRLIGRFVADEGDGQRAEMVLPVRSEVTELTARVLGVAEAVTLTPPEPRPIFRVGLRVESSSRMEGEWSRETTDDGLPGDIADQTWSRGTHVAGVVDITRYVEGISGNPIVGGSAGGPAHRVLLVHGSNLPVGPEDIQIFRSDDVHLTYRFGGDATGSSEHWEMAGGVREDGAEAMLVHATIDEGGTLGHKTLTVNGAPSRWVLDNPGVPARIGFVWDHGDVTPIGDVASTPLDHAYGMETLFLEIDLAAPILADEITIFPLLDGEPVQLTVPIGDTEVLSDPVPLTARRVFRHLKHDQFEFRSEPIRLWRTDRPGEEPPADPSSLTLGVKGGAVLAALADPRTVTTLPARPEVHIDLDPMNAGSLWRQALDRVAACPGGPPGGVTDHASFMAQPGHIHDPDLLTTTRDLSISLRNGDLAALLLIRDEFVRQMTGPEGVIEPYRQRSLATDEVLAAYRAEVRRTGEAERDAFWQVMTAQSPPPRDPDEDAGEDPDEDPDEDPAVYPLWMTLDLDALLAGGDQVLADMSHDELEQWAVDQTRLALQQYVLDMEAAVKRAIDAGNCNTAELLVIGGQEADALHAGLMPRLVEWRTDGQPPRSLVAPDRDAQSYVTTVHEAAAQIRTLDEYAEIDGIYQSMAVALATSFTGYGFASVAAKLGKLAHTSATAARAASACRAAGYLTHAVSDAYDVYGAVKAYDDVATANERRQAARGASALLGQQQYWDTVSKGGSATWALVSALAPTAATKIPTAVRTPGMLKRYLTATVEPGAVQRGAKLAGGGLDRAAIEAMPETERMDLAAWALHKHLIVQEQGLEAVPMVERQILGEIETLVLAKGARTAAPSAGIATPVHTPFEAPSTHATPGGTAADAIPNAGGNTPTTVPNPAGSTPATVRPGNTPATVPPGNTPATVRPGNTPATVPGPAGPPSSASSAGTPGSHGETYLGEDLRHLRETLEARPADPYAATLPGQVIPPRAPRYSELAEGEYHAITRQGDTVSVNLGPHIGGGSFNDVYVNATPLLDGAPPETLFRISKPTMGGVNPSVHLDAVGREALKGADRDALSTVEVVAAMDLIDPTGQIRRLEVIERFKSSWREIDGIQPMTPGQAIAFDRATRELNSRGYVWLDSHHLNYVFEPLGGKDEWRLCVFDPGGIVPVRQVDDPAALARRIQREVNAPTPHRELDNLASQASPNAAHFAAANDVLQGRLAPLLERAVDPETLGVERMDQFTEYLAAGAVRHPHVQQLFLADDPEAAYAALTARVSTTGN